MHKLGKHLILKALDSSGVMSLTVAVAGRVINGLHIRISRILTKCHVQALDIGRPRSGVRSI